MSGGLSIEIGPSVNQSMKRSNRSKEALKVLSVKRKAYFLIIFLGRACVRFPRAFDFGVVSVREFCLFLCAERDGFS